MITARLEARVATARLNLLLLRVNDTTKVFKTWGTAVANEAKNNARAKGGRSFWKKIADSTRLHSVSKRAGTVQCFDYIGEHKEYGGPIRAKNGKYLTIPINAMSKGYTVGEMENRGVDVFRLPGTKVLVTAHPGGDFTALYALVEETKPQRPDPWWPKESWVMAEGIKHAKAHLK